MSNPTGHSADNGGFDRWQKKFKKFTKFPRIFAGTVALAPMGPDHNSPTWAANTEAGTVTFQGHHQQLHGHPPPETRRLVREIGTKLTTRLVLKLSLPAIKVVFWVLTKV
jgi:hypothetical protein